MQQELFPQQPLVRRERGRALRALLALPPPNPPDLQLQQKEPEEEIKVPHGTLSMIPGAWVQGQEEDRQAAGDHLRVEAEVAFITWI